MKGAKGRANQALLAAACLFVVAVSINVVYPGYWGSRVLLIVTEAGLVGGVADWFAVTALFRRPLGFPYHTALIPRNRQRLIDSLASAVENDFLSKDAIKARLNEAIILDRVFEHAEKNDMRPFMRQMAERLLDGFVAAILPETAARQAERALKLVLTRQAAAPRVAAVARWALTQGKGQVIYTAIVARLAAKARDEATRERIFLYLEQVKQKTAKKNWLSALVTGFMESIDGINTADAANALHQELIKTVDGLSEDDHPVRRWFEEQLAALAANLETPAWEQLIDEWKDSLIIRLSLSEQLTELVQTMLKALERPSPYRSRVAEWLTEQAELFWQQFKENDAFKVRVEGYLKALIGSIIDNEHYLLGQVACRALQKLSDEDLSRFIEDKAGEDLAWIRINGVIVGGLAGLALAALKALL